MTPPRSAFGASPPGGRLQRTGEAGSAQALGVRPLDAAHEVARDAAEQFR
jgi:hypothetical protein